MKTPERYEMIPSASRHANADLARTNPPLTNEWSKLGMAPIVFGVAQNAATSAMTACQEAQ